MTDERGWLYVIGAVLGLVLGAGFSVYWNGADFLLTTGAVCVVVGVVWYFTTRQP